jgi:translocation and assembly module TamB
LSKRFQITRGSALFPGGRDLNPTLQITGEYQVQVPGNPQMNIKVLIGGTMRKPKLSLTSDAQPPKSQSELLSLLAFGNSTSSLLSLDGSSISGNPTATGLVGLGTQYAVGRVAGVAMGVVVDEVETKAGKALGTDYLNITPADVPTEVAQKQSVGNFFQQTEIEAGKYVNPRTFVEAQTVGGYPGFRVQYRTNDGWIYEGNSEPRILLLPPSLSEQPFRTRAAVGVIILRRWVF